MSRIFPRYGRFDLFPSRRRHDRTDIKSALSARREYKFAAAAIRLIVIALGCALFGFFVWSALILWL